MNIDIVNNRYLYLDYSQHDCICRLLANGLCLICKKKVCICDELLKADWDLLLPSSPLMPLSPSNFNYISLPKAIPASVSKTYTAVVFTPVSNEQMKNIRKVYDEKIANLDKQLSQEVKQHQLEEKQMKYIITQLVHQKQELEDKLTKTAPITISSTLSKPSTTKPSFLSSLILKKPNSTNPKSNVKYVLITPKEALTLKTPAFIKFNQIQIENIETENFSTPTPRQGDVMQKEINKITNIKVSTPIPRQEEIQMPQIMFLKPKPLPQTSFVVSKTLSDLSTADSLLIKRKYLRMSKHKTTTKKTFSTNPPKFKCIEKPKDVIKKT
jgi:hypothetical protein